MDEFVMYVTPSRRMPLALHCCASLFNSDLFNSAPLRGPLDARTEDSYRQGAYVRILAARCARGLHQFHPLRKRGRRESRAPIAPAVARTRAHEWTTGEPDHPGFPCAKGYGLYVVSPVSPALLPPSPCGLTIHASPVGPDASPHGLTPAWGRQDHTTSPSAPVSPKLLPVLVHPASSSEDSFKRRSSARRMIAHGVQSALRSLARPTLSRPSHPTARS